MLDILLQQVFATCSIFEEQQNKLEVKNRDFESYYVDQKLKIHESFAAIRKRIDDYQEKILDSLSYDWKESTSLLNSTLTKSKSNFRQLRLLLNDLKQEK